VDILLVSTLRETEPVGFLDQPPFLNGAAMIETSLDPESLLTELLAVELELGRDRPIHRGERFDLEGLAQDRRRLEDRQIVVADALILAQRRQDERAGEIVVAMNATAFEGTIVAAPSPEPGPLAPALAHPAVTIAAAAASIAEELARSLDPGTRIVSSRSRRALQTATAIAAAAGLGPVEIDPRWSEADMGIAEGRTFAELERMAPDLARALADGDAAIDWPGGETSADLAGRVESAWHALRVADRDAVVVSHGGPLRIAMALALGVPASTLGPIEPAAIVRLPAGSDR
jgi:2-amino-4-hydroxy-6-hydroxymethyldihydropteridine diphosphokinase